MSEVNNFTDERAQYSTGNRVKNIQLVDGLDISGESDPSISYERLSAAPDKYPLS